MLALLLVAATCFLAYANGANDNFKGVASLHGSGTSGRRPALAWATVTTLAGSLTAILLGEELLRGFSGRGLVAESLTTETAFLASVAAGAGCTVLLATRLGFPVSTTHGLTGALVGSGWAADAGGVGWVRLWEGFARPLLLSPMIAMAAGGVLYFGMRMIRVAPDHRTRTLDVLHFLSAGAVGFARGLNDTPKIAAMFLVLAPLGAASGLALVGVMMAVGGWLAGRRVAATMSHKITGMNPGQGFGANLATALLVSTASGHGLPVSTTHVSVGSLLGIGIATGRARWRTVIPVLLSWLVTLPCAAVFGAVACWILRLPGWGQATSAAC